MQKNSFTSHYEGVIKTLQRVLSFVYTEMGQATSSVSTTQMQKENNVQRWGAISAVLQSYYSALLFLPKRIPPT